MWCIQIGTVWKVTLFERLYLLNWWSNLNSENAYSSVFVTGRICLNVCSCSKVVAYEKWAFSNRSDLIASQCRWIISKYTCWPAWLAGDGWGFPEWPSIGQFTIKRHIIDISGERGLCWPAWVAEDGRGFPEWPPTKPRRRTVPKNSKVGQR